MNRPALCCCTLLFAMLSLELAPCVSAQQRAPGTQTFVPSPQALGMGGAATAYPSPHTALFYNPAHLTQLRVTRAPVTMLGFSVSLSNDFSRQVDFYKDRLQPALDRGINNLDEEEERALYNDMLRMASSPTVIGADVLLPSFVLNRGSYGFGGGVFAHSQVNYNVEDAGAGVPGVDFTALVDLMAVASGASDFSALGVQGLSAGLTAKYVQRYVSLKLKPLDAIDEDESFYVLGASTVTADVGLLYEAFSTSAPGRLYLGLAVSDLSLKDLNYRFSAYYAKNEKVQNDEKIAGEVALAQQRYQLLSSFRAGAAYVLPDLAGPLKETAVAVDYIHYQDALIEQPLLGHLSLGLQTTVGKALSLRTGLNQGYTTVGVGLHLSFVQIDYAYYGSELGRLPGQSPGWHHHLQFSLGSF